MAMQNNSGRGITPYKGGFLPEISLRIKLIAKLMSDRRVSVLLKAIPVASLIYFFVYPDLAIGPIDDALVIWLTSYLFVDLCPDEVVEEHIARLKHVILPGENNSPTETPPEAPKADVVDAEFKDINEE
jgi:hypothetical protein